MKFLMSLLLLVSINVSAQDDFDGDYESIDSETIDIGGEYSGAQRVDPADRLRKFRQRMEKKHEMMIKKKIEMLRYRQEMEMAKKIQRQMNKVYSNMNEQMDNL